MAAPTARTSSSSELRVAAPCLCLVDPEAKSPQERVHCRTRTSCAGSERNCADQFEGLGLQQTPNSITNMHPPEYGQREFMAARAISCMPAAHLTSRLASWFICWTQVASTSWWIQLHLVWGRSARGRLQPIFGLRTERVLWGLRRNARLWHGEHLVVISFYGRMVLPQQCMVMSQ